MISFILNDREVRADLPAGTALLDYIRYGRGLKGTKIGCREGDCGACTVLEGRLAGNSMVYRSIVSCLTPLGNAHGRHIVTIEGLNMDSLSAVQQAFVDHNASQCGFCTPGFVVALTGHAIRTVRQHAVPTAYSSDTAQTKLTGDISPADDAAATSGRSSDHATRAAVASMDGNICRCTGYKSIERAAASVARLLRDKDPGQPMEWLTENGFLPAYFLTIPERLKALTQQSVIDATAAASTVATGAKHSAGQQEHGHGRPVVLGGGTDFMVQRPDSMAEAAEPLLLQNHPAMQGIRREGDTLFIGAAATATDIATSEVMQALFPDIGSYFKLISSDPIRNMGTVGGNIVNASPIGDLSIIFLALGATLHIEHSADGSKRQLPLGSFFLGYKRYDLQAGELITALSFAVPPKGARYSFEKVSKRTHLDIASVNSAMLVETSGNDDSLRISRCLLSCGGVAPVPLLLTKTAAFLTGKTPDSETLTQANAVMQDEIAPISDIRGSETYKRLLARQLLHAHFLKMLPGYQVARLPSYKKTTRSGQ